MIQNELLKNKCILELKKILPYNDLSFNATVMLSKIVGIKLEMRGKYILITKGKKQFFNKYDEVRQCLIDIYYEFEDEIQVLFNLSIDK